MPKGGYFDDRQSEQERQLADFRSRSDAIHRVASASVDRYRAETDEYRALLRMQEDVRDSIIALPDDHEETMRSMGFDLPPRDEKLAEANVEIEATCELIARRERTAEAFLLHFQIEDAMLSPGKRAAAKQRYAELHELGIDVLWPTTD